MNIVIIGPKGAGKSSVGAALADLLELPLLDTDKKIEEIHNYENRSFREIYKRVGEETFRALEQDAVQKCCEEDWHVITTGGGTFLDTGSRNTLRQNGAFILYLTADKKILWERAIKDGIPPFLEGPDGKQKFYDQVAQRDEVIRPYADAIIETDLYPPEMIAELAAQRLSEELVTRARSANTYGDIIRITTFGESHGPAIGAIMEGLKPGIDIDESAIYEQMQRRRPGQSKVVTQRKEADNVKILSGVFEGKTTGAPRKSVV